MGRQPPWDAREVGERRDDAASEFHPLLLRWWWEQEGGVAGDGDDDGPLLEWKVGPLLEKGKGEGELVAVGGAGTTGRR